MNEKIREYYANQQQLYFENEYKNKYNSDSEDNNDNSKKKKKHKFKTYFMLDTLFYDSGKFRNNISKIFSHENKRLKGNKVEIISKLRTEHIALMAYSNEILGHPSDKCPSCQVKETVEHFLMDCPTFETARDNLRQELVRLNIEFNNEAFFTIENVLFPHLWVVLPDPDEEEYKDKWNAATNTRVRVLQLVTEFVEESKRFYGKDNI